MFLLFLVDRCSCPLCGSLSYTVTWGSRRKMSYSGRRWRWRGWMRTGRKRPSCDVTSMVRQSLSGAGWTMSSFCREFIVESLCPKLSVTTSAVPHCIEQVITLAWIVSTEIPIITRYSPNDIKSKLKMYYYRIFLILDLCMSCTLYLEASVCRWANGTLLTH